MKTFFKNMPGEFKKLTFPTAKKIRENLITVVSGCAIMAIIVAILDIIFSSTVGVVLSLF